MKKWFQKVANFLEEEDLRVDLNKFKDPEAKVISWQALQPSQGSNRKAMDLEYKNKDQLFIKIGKAMRVFFLIPMVIVLVGILELINLDPLETGSVGPGFKQIVLMVLFFLGFAGFFLWFYFEMYAQTVCMDKNQKKITKKSKKINWKAFKLESSTEQYSLKDLLAIQVLRKYVEDFHANYLSYEINLVLHDHKRINIIDHGDEEAIEMQVKKISEFLKLPVWKSY